MSTYSLLGPGLGAEATVELEKSLLKSSQPLGEDTNPI